VNIKKIKLIALILLVSAYGCAERQDGESSAFLRLFHQSTSPSPVNVDTPPITAPPANPGQDNPKPITPGPVKVDDPVSLSNGAFFYSETDFNMRSATGIGLDLVRNYLQNYGFSRFYVGKNWKTNFHQGFGIIFKKRYLPQFKGPQKIPQEVTDESDSNAPWLPELETFWVTEDSRIEKFENISGLKFDLWNGSTNLRVKSWLDGVNWDPLTKKFTMPNKVQVRERNGRIFHFALKDGSELTVPGATMYWLTAIEHPRQGKITIEYGAASSQASKVRYWVKTIKDPSSRIVYDFDYELNGQNYPRRLRGVHDRILGRYVSYEHDSFGNLVKVTLPPTQQGLTPEIGYDYGQIGANNFPTPDLNLLVKVTRPNEMLSGGAPSVINQYQFAGVGGFSPVVSQIWGGTNSSGRTAGGKSVYLREGTNVLIQGQPAHKRVLYIDRGGVVSLAYFNQSGNLLLMYRFTGLIDGSQVSPQTAISNLVVVNPTAPNGNSDRLLSPTTPKLRTSDPHSFFTTYSFDDRANPTEMKTDSGVTHRYTYDAQNSDAFQKDNLLSHEVEYSNGTKRKTTLIYDPLYNQMRAVTNHLNQIQAQFIFDYQEGDWRNSSEVTTQVNRWKIDMKQSSSNQNGTSVRKLESLSGLNDQNGDGVVTETAGNVVRSISPDMQQFRNPKIPSLGLISKKVASSYIHNKYGQVIAQKDPVGLETRYQFHDLSAPFGGSATPGQSWGALTYDKTNGGGFLAKSMTPAGDLTVYESDAGGRNIGVVDARDNVTRYEYDDFDRIIEVEDSLQHKGYRVYDASGNLVETRAEYYSADQMLPLVSAPNLALKGMVIDRYQYDILGNQIVSDVQVNLPGSPAKRAIEKMYFDRNSRLVLSLSPLASLASSSEPTNYTSVLYDERGLLYQNAAGGFPNQFASVPANFDLPALAQETNKAVTTSHYDNFGKITEVIDAQGKIHHSEFDVLGRLNKITGPGQEVVEFKFDELDRVTLIENKDAQGTTLARQWSVYDSIGNVLERSRWFQKANGTPGLEGPLRPGDGKVNMVYQLNERGEHLVVVSDNGQTTTFIYDQAGRLSRQSQSDGEKRYVYEAGGLIKQTHHIAKNLNQATKTITQTLTRDAAGRVIVAEDSLNSRSEFFYDNLGNMVWKKDPRQNVSASVYDREGNVTLVQMALHAGGRGGANLDTSISDGIVELSSQFDLNGRQISMSDPNGNVTRYEYDSFNRKRKKVNADGTFSYVQSFNQVHNPESIVDEAGNVTHLTYNLNGAIEQKQVLPAGGLGTPYLETTRYDGLGRVKSIQKQGITLSYDYDTLSNKEREATNGQTMEYEFDSMGRIVLHRYPNNLRTIRRFYSPHNGMLQELRENSGELIAKYNYGFGSEVESIDYGNGSKTENQYDNYSRLIGQRHVVSGQTMMQKNWQYDEAMNPLNLTKTINTVSGPVTRSTDYHYDSLSRLLSVNRSNFSGAIPLQEFFQIDEAGNRTQNYTLNGRMFENNQYSNSILGTHLYDDLGNMTQSGAANRSFSVENELIQNVHLGTSVQFIYDPLGRRIQKNVLTAGGTLLETKYFYCGMSICGEQTDLNNTQQISTYVYTDSGSPISIQKRSGNSFNDYFVFKDPLGSTEALTDSNSQLMESYEYSVFGTPYDAQTLQPVSGSTSNMATPFLFAGRPFDVESGLYYNSLRYFDPALGRFISKDPLGAFGDSKSLGNAYTYGANNPLRYVDPLGTEAKEMARRLLEQERELLRLLNNAFAAMKNPEASGNYLNERVEPFNKKMRELGYDEVPDWALGKGQSPAQKLMLSLLQRDLDNGSQYANLNSRGVELAMTATLPADFSPFGPGGAKPEGWRSVVDFLLSPLDSLTGALAGQPDDAVFFVAGNGLSAGARAAAKRFFPKQVTQNRLNGTKVAEALSDGPAFDKYIKSLGSNRAQRELAISRFAEKEGPAYIMGEVSDARFLGLIRDNKIPIDYVLLNDLHGAYSHAAQIHFLQNRFGREAVREYLNGISEREFLLTFDRFPVNVMEFKTYPRSPEFVNLKLSDRELPNTLEELMKLK
jgi:RHS repeat-associated protein